MADIQKMKPIKTAHGMLEVYKDWDCEGAIYMKNPKTIDRYKEIMKEEPDSDEYGIFWAFSNQQFEEGVDRMIKKGLFKKGEKVYSIGAGGYGVDKKLIDEFFAFYKNRRKRAAEECDPQEVYLYEYNNHECMIDWEGDKAAYDIIVSMYGEEVANGITRFSIMN